MAGSAYGNGAMGYPNLDGNHVRGDDGSSKPAANYREQIAVLADAGIDKSELCADLTSEGGAVIERALRHDGFQTRLRSGRTQCVENLALEPHAVDPTRPGFPCSASFMGKGLR